MPTNPATSKFAGFDAELSKPTFRCKLCAAIADMGSEDAAYVRQMLAAPFESKGHKHISTVLERGGVDVSPTTIGDCRRAKHQPSP